MLVKIASLILTYYIIVFEFTKAELTGFIVGGKYAKIKDFPHSVFLHITSSKLEAGCGASILNQAILLTAAHCVTPCKNDDCALTAHVGSKFKYVGSKRNVIGYKTHEFDEKSLINDIALLLLRTGLKLGKYVGRIIVMKNPPKYKTGKVAGWGRVVNADEGAVSLELKYTSQQIINRDTCIAMMKTVPNIRTMPIGTFCVHDSSHVNNGDSGSALVVRKRTIQIGIASYIIMYGKKRNVTAVYTNVSYHYDWIMDNASNFYCEKEKWQQEKGESSDEIEADEDGKA